jgi:hypothetical protein
MIIRTFGWIQNAAKTSSLKSLVKVFVYDSDINKTLRETKLERMIKDANDKDYFARLISAEKMNIPYKALKGRGHGDGVRRTAPCSGIAQAAIPVQGGKEYTDDWSADCFLRWAFFHITGIRIHVVLLRPGHCLRIRGKIPAKKKNV